LGNRTPSRLKRRQRRRVGRSKNSADVSFVFSRGTRRQSFHVRSIRVKSWSKCNICCRDLTRSQTLCVN
jgi:hypothetical protein